MRIRRVVPTAMVAVVAVAGVGGTAIATASGHASAASATISVKSTSLGKILVNSAGLTVYMWKKDKQHAKTSACTGSCLALWPLVTVSGKPTAGPGVSASKLGTIKVGGKNEVTYNGWPLYTYKADTKPGQTTGQGSMSPPPAWYVLSPAGEPITKK
jgi:predicted lipoprotein with Yx(FWY)xxD motif